MVNVPTYLVVVYELANEIERFREKNREKPQASKQKERLPGFHPGLDSSPARRGHVAPKCETFACITD